MALPTVEEKVEDDKTEKFVQESAVQQTVELMDVRLTENERLAFKLEEVKENKTMKIRSWVVSNAFQATRINFSNTALISDLCKAIITSHSEV